MVCSHQCRRNENDLKQEWPAHLFLASFVVAAEWRESNLGSRLNYQQCKKLGKIFAGLTYKLLSSITVISDVYNSFIRNKATFTYCLTQWISKLSGSFEIHWVRQYLGNFMSLVGIVNTTIYKSKPIFTGLGHGKLSWFLTHYQEQKWPSVIHASVIPILTFWQQLHSTLGTLVYVMNLFLLTATHSWCQLLFSAARYQKPPHWLVRTYWPS